MPDFAHDESQARALDATDPLAHFRDRFHIPPDPNDPSGKTPTTYLCGNSLGCMPRTVEPAMARELTAWKDFAVEGHFHQNAAGHDTGGGGWYDFHALLRDPLAHLVGAKPREVVAMNSLTVNLHLLMLSFYRPTHDRFRILIDRPTFPSDSYAVASQVRLHKLDPDQAIIRLAPRASEGEHTLREEDIEQTLASSGDEIALVLLSGLNFATGQLYDIPRLISAIHAHGAIAALDLAHAVGNVPLQLHDWNADFAVWCHYKYCNSGPGAVAGAFIHEHHLDRPDFQSMPRLEGWWGNDPAQRFLMTEDFVPVRSADAWQTSNPPILAMVPVRESLAIFDEATLPALRTKSEKLTSYLESLVNHIPSDRISIITPSDPNRRGCQLSIAINMGGNNNPRALFDQLAPRAVICDFRQPNIIRVAPTPLYNTFADCHRFATVLADLLRA